MTSPAQGGPHRVVVVGGGFGGLQAALKLARQDAVEVTLVDRRNFHLFQPLAYQVATGALAAAEVCYPLRHVFARHRNVQVMLAEVSDVELDARRVRVRNVVNDTPLEPLPYDTLIVSGGSRYSYFGHDEWRNDALELKSLEGALELRRRILSAFEAAALEADPPRRAAELTFVVVGGGPTGVEMAGQIAEVAHDLRKDMHTYDTSQARILLIEATDRVLSSFPPELSEKAKRALEQLGVTARLNESVIDVDAHGVSVRREDGSVERIDSETIVWAAGVVASSLARLLAERVGEEPDRAGRVTVEPDLSLPGHPEVLAIGDMVAVRRDNGERIVLPGLAPVAMQQGRHAARVVAARVAGRAQPAFRYVDKGNIATIGRARAVADIRHVQLSGFIAWATWLLVHLWYLIGFENRLLVLTRWSFSFFGRGRGARLVAHAPDAPGR
ncbi:MAG TPA: NAD(P)/FAD-dependent oxidoreductase [Conexibacter sp.]|jgi:NADH dehydrogenase